MRRWRVHRRRRVDHTRCWCLRRLGCVRLHRRWRRWNGCHHVRRLIRSLQALRQINATHHDARDEHGNEQHDGDASSATSLLRGCVWRRCIAWGLSVARWWRISTLLLPTLGLCVYGWWAVSTLWRVVPAAGWWAVSALWRVVSARIATIERHTDRCSTGTLGRLERGSQRRGRRGSILTNHRKRCTDGRSTS